MLSNSLLFFVNKPKIPLKGKVVSVFNPDLPSSENRERRSDIWVGTRKKNLDVAQSLISSVNIERQIARWHQTSSAVFLICIIPSISIELTRRWSQIFMLTVFLPFCIFGRIFCSLDPSKIYSTSSCPKLSTEEKKIVFQEDATLQVIRLHQTTKHVKDVEML